jgi:hemolysin III
MSTIDETLALNPGAVQEVALPYPNWRDMNEERANAITHGAGFLLSIPAALFIMQLAIRTGDPWHIAGITIYSLTMMGVYLASTLSHVVHEPKRKHFCRQLDQAAIYLFIAGTFTPFAFNYVRDGWWIVLPILIWTIALAGAGAKLFLSHRIHGVEIPVYVLLGWLPGLSALHVAQVVPLGALWWMMAGGLCYTFGTWFLRNDHRAWWIHSIWHILVILGTACHYVAILLYVSPQ